MKPECSRKRGLALLLAVLTGVLLMTLPGCFRVNSEKTSPKASPPQASLTPPSEPAMEFSSTSLSSLEKGKDRWELKAEGIRFDQKKKKAVAKEITVVFLGSAGKEVLTLRAPGAEVDLPTRSLVFLGRVFSRASTGETLTALRMRWDGLRKLLYGSGGVELVRGNSVITGEQLLADPALKTVEFLGKVRVRLKGLP